MQKLLALVMTVLFGGSILMVAGCAPKQESMENSAPAMEESAPAMNDEGAPAMEEATPGMDEGTEEAAPEESMPQE